MAPGGSVNVTWVCDRSSGGMKPVGNSGTNRNEPTKVESTLWVVLSSMTSWVARGVTLDVAAE